ncbi:MAG: hypothetical protein ABIG61_14690 [Planctomycetota bacterium]
MSKTTRCFRLGFTKEQGIGFSEVTGDSWPMPEARTGVLNMVDSNKYPHLLVIDHRDGMFYDVATVDGPEDSGLTKYYKDKVATDGTGGTDIEPSVEWPEDSGSDENMIMRSRLSYLYTRPTTEDNRGATGYTASGYPSGLEITKKTYVDGERTDETAKAEAITLPKHRIKYDKKVEGTRIFNIISANKSDWSIVGRRDEYVSSDRPDASDNEETAEDGYEDEFAEPIFWLGYYRGQLMDRANGVNLNVTHQRTEGLDSYSGSAIRFWNPINLGSLSAMTAGTLMLWYKEGALSITIGGTLYPITSHNTSGGWTLAYADGITDSGELIITPTIAAQIYDLRIFAGAISSDAREYYYYDVNKHDGKQMLPIVGL